MSSPLRHRKTSSEPPSMDQSTSRQVQMTALSLTSLLTTLTTTEGITTTARKLYTYPTKRLSSSDLFRTKSRVVSDEDVIIASSGVITPPPDYEEESLALTPSSSSSSSTTTISLPIPTSSDNTEDQSLVSAKFAMQGHNLLSLSLAEPSNSSFRRHLYLDSLTYLLRALPSDLSPSETTQLISSLPSVVVESLEPSSATTQAGIPQQRSYEHPTIHYFLLVLTATTVSSIRNLTPHLKALAQSTWEYNLRYRVAERGYDRVRKTVDGGFAFWKAVAEWVMFDDYDNTRGSEDMVIRNGRKLRYGGGVVRDVGKYAGGVIRSGVGGMVEGFVEGMK
ncbi:hypothetical protein TWF506_005797 [Arthrobotrys conoides]|uniref:Uncharacterized protein n=1 Tax=Arthrobotrys conoides TaxID=74498 RepID=A0AAN8NX90_9PEZI